MANWKTFSSCAHTCSDVIQIDKMLVTIWHSVCNNASKLTLQFVLILVLLVSNYWGYCFCFVSLFR